MSMMGSSSWGGQEPGLQAASESDFQFLDLDSINLGDGLHFDFHDFQNANGAHMVPQLREMDTPMGGTDGGAGIPTSGPSTLNGQMHPATAGNSHAAIATSMMPLQGSTTAIDDIDAQIHFLQQQKHLQQQRQQQQQQQHHQHLQFQESQKRQQQQQAAFFAAHRHGVPPTPQSLDLQAGTQFYHHTPEQHSQQHVMFENYHQMPDQHDMSFTPLVSPAVTPLESHFPVDTHFTIPGAYFSPLTSPALVAQNDPAMMFNQAQGISAGNSPRDLDLENNKAPSSGELGRKPRRTVASKARKAGVRQSPITKPQRKKTLTTPNMNAQVLNQLTESMEESRMDMLPPAAPATSTSSTTGTTDSENGSVSPETLSEMPPPPLPKIRSARASPMLHAQTNFRGQGHVMPGQPSPATPASLMKLPSPSSNNKSNTSGASDSQVNETIETFELPESVNTPVQKHQLTPIITTPQPASPAIESQISKGPAAQALSSPARAKVAAPAPVAVSPQITPGSATPTAKKPPHMLPKTSRKRGSVSSIHISPALLPRISPNIKPLLPGGTSAEDHASRLLATKSNYQNILEGNKVPGVFYPSELTTNLSSKRTSHKIAEQGRRNRINSALQEMSALLPQSATAEKEVEEDGGDKKDKSGATPNSKASTVEQAIDYIKELKEALAAATKKAEEATARADVLAARLEAQAKDVVT